MNQKQRQHLIDRAFEETNTSRCLQGIEGLCHSPPVAGHIIPHSRLNLIKEDNTVRVFEPIPFSKMRGALRESPGRPVSPGIATTENFLCCYHEKRPFQEIEQSDLRWDISRQRLMRNLMLLTYKALLPTYAREEWTVAAWNRLAELTDDTWSYPEAKAHPEAKTPQDVSDDFQYLLHQTAEIKTMLEQWLRDADYENMVHFITQTGLEPIVAANGFFIPQGFIIAGANVGSQLSYRAPQCITAYPSTDGQWVIRSLITPGHSGVSIRRTSRSNVAERHKEAQMASILLLQECETIAIGPKVWRKYGNVKRQTITDHFLMAVPYASTPFLTVRQMSDPQLLNLFNTTPI